MSETQKPISRTQAVKTTVNEIQTGENFEVTLKQLLDHVENIVVQSGGKADLAASERALNKTLKYAEELGVLVIHRHVTVERVK